MITDSLLSRVFEQEKDKNAAPDGKMAPEEQQFHDLLFSNPLFTHFVRDSALLIAVAGSRAIPAQFGMAVWIGLQLGRAEATVAAETEAIVGSQLS